MNIKEKIETLKAETDKISEAASTLELEVGSAFFCNDSTEELSDEAAEKLLNTAKELVVQLKASADIIETL